MQSGWCLGLFHARRGTRVKTLDYRLCGNEGNDGELNEPHAPILHHAFVNKFIFMITARNL